MRFSNVCWTSAQTDKCLLQLAATSLNITYPLIKGITGRSFLFHLPAEWTVKHIYKVLITELFLSLNPGSDKSRFLSVCCSNSVGSCTENIFVKRIMSCWNLVIVSPWVVMLMSCLCYSIDIDLNWLIAMVVGFIKKVNHGQHSPIIAVASCSLNPNWSAKKLTTWLVSPIPLGYSATSVV